MYLLGSNVEFKLALFYDELRLRETWIQKVFGCIPLFSKKNRCTIIFFLDIFEVILLTY